MPTLGNAAKRQIEKEEVYGHDLQIDRRDALKWLGLGVTSLLGLDVAGAALANVGVANENFDHKLPFRAIGGVFDGKTLHLPSGISLALGQYANPIIVPGVFHGAPTSALNADIIDQLSVVQNLMRPKDGAPDSGQILKTARGLRVWQLLVQDGNEYQLYDLSEQSIIPPRIQIDADGAVTVQVGDQMRISRADGIYLRELQQIDMGRFDSGAVLGICTPGQPPSAQAPILFTELDTPIIPTLSAIQNWQGNRRVLVPQPLHHNVLDETNVGETFIQGGANVWRYRYFSKDAGTVIFGADCKRVGEVPSEEWKERWDSMGPRQFYTLETEGRKTLLHPEPDLGKALNVTTFNSGGDELFATGIVIWSMQGGRVIRERTSLSKLGGSANVTIEGNDLLVGRPSGLSRYRITELRKKSGFAENAADAFAIDTATISCDQLPEKPVVSVAGSYNIMAARQAAQSIFGV